MLGKEFNKGGSHIKANLHRRRRSEHNTSIKGKNSKHCCLQSHDEKWGAIEAFKWYHLDSSVYIYFWFVFFFYTDSLSDISRPEIAPNSVTNDSVILNWGVNDLPGTTSNVTFLLQMAVILDPDHSHVEDTNWVYSDLGVWSFNSSSGVVKGLNPYTHYQVIACSEFTLL